MAQKTVEFTLGRGSEMGPDGQPVPSPLAPVDLPEPDIESDNMLVNVGPQHPATHGVLRLVCELDGETVVRCIPHIGYLHSSFEKLGEYRGWNQVVPLTDRMDYLAPLIYNIAYVMSVEAMMGIQVTERCKLIRVIMMELDRIFGHLLWLGTFAMDIGAFTPFLYTFEERERIYTLHDQYTGARITTSATRVGGMMADMPEGWDRGVRDFANGLPRTLDECELLLNENGLVLGRTQDIGVISGKEAVNYGFTGANLRGSGVAYDVRKDQPYYDYETYDFEVPIGEHGDCYDRYLVRMEEMRQSLRIIHQALDRLEKADGPMDVEDPRITLPRKTDAMNDMESMIHHFKIIMEGIHAPVGESYFPVEGSKGELGMYVVSDGGTKPVRWRVRPPSFLNLSVLPTLLEGHLLADLITINASIDIVLGEIDR
ncbi:MAG: NADH dehydrogenase (quinone) subunit D [Longimicrobiales bacterium]